MFSRHVFSIYCFQCISLPSLFTYQHKIEKTGKKSKFYLFYRPSSSPKFFPHVLPPNSSPKLFPQTLLQDCPQDRSKIAVEQCGKPSVLVNFQSYNTIFIVFPLWECFWIYIFTKMWRTNTLDMVNRGIFFWNFSTRQKNLTKIIEICVQRWLMQQQSWGFVQHQSQTFCATQTCNTEVHHFCNQKF